MNRVLRFDVPEGSRCRCGAAMGAVGVLELHMTPGFERFECLCAQCAAGNAAAEDGLEAAIDLYESVSALSKAYGPRKIAAEGVTHGA